MQPTINTSLCNELAVKTYIEYEAGNRKTFYYGHPVVLHSSQAQQLISPIEQLAYIYIGVCNICAQKKKWMHI